MERVLNGNLPQESPPEAELTGDLKLLRRNGKRNGSGERPTRRTIDRVWLVVVWALAIVLVGSAATLAASVFVGGTSAEMLLTIFTTVVGFVAGLLTPTPVQHDE